MNSLKQHHHNYWFFVFEKGHLKWSTVEGPEMKIEDATNYFQEKFDIKVLEIGYGNEVPKGFRNLPKYIVQN